MDMVDSNISIEFIKPFAKKFYEGINGEGATKVRVAKKKVSRGLDSMTPAAQAMYEMSGRYEYDREKARTRKMKVNDRAERMQASMEEMMESMERIREAEEETHTTTQQMTLEEALKKQRPPSTRGF
jgi:hypothetical protein